MNLKRIIIAILLLATALLLTFIWLPHGEPIQADHAGEHGAQGVTVNGLEISGAWTRATVDIAKVGGGYIAIKNTGDDADRLISGSADFANDVQLHEMTLVDDVMRMRPLENGIAIPAGGQVLLKPGAQHLMFMGLKRPLVQGETVTVSLRFETAGDVSVSFKVKSLGGKGATGHAAGHATEQGEHSGH